MDEDNQQPGTSGLIFPKVDKKQDSDSDDSDYYDSENEDTEVKIDLIPDNLPEDYESGLEKNLLKDMKKRKKNEASASSGSQVKRKAQSKIPVHLKGLMGQANIMFAQGNIELTEKMCYEIIRQVPLAWEPYLTLAHLYESTHIAKSMQYLTIAAHLQSKNPFHWIRLAELHTENNNLKQAVTCYTNAIAGDPTNVDLHYKRIKLLERLNDNRFIQRCKVRLLNTLKSKNHNQIIPLAKEITEKYHAEGEYQKAIEAMYVPFNKCSEHITLDLVNIMLELLLLTKSYTNCIDIFVQFCNIEIEILIDDDRKINVVSYNMPENILIDLRIKFIICMIKLEAYHLLDQLLAPLLDDENVETIGDLYLDVAEALMIASRHSDALKLLIPLVKSRNFSLAAVWLKYAECLKCCNMDEQAIESYYTVVRMAPQHTEVRHSLGELLIKNDKLDEAATVMTQDTNSNEIDVSLVIKKIDLLVKLERYIEYYNSIVYMLSRHCILVKHFEEIREILQQDKMRDRVTRINSHRKLRGDDTEISFPTSAKEPSVEEEYKIVKQALDTAYKKKHFLHLQKMAVTALSSVRFKQQMEELTLICFFGCMTNNDLYHAYTLAREIVIRNIDHVLSWNFFGLIMLNLEETRYSRFLLRLARNHDNDHLRMCLANNALSSINTKFALMQLVYLLQKKPDPFKLLMMGMVFVQFIFKKKVPLNRKSLMQIIYGFMMSYADTRSKDASHEVYYNLGRLYHHYGILHLASMYYKKVLDFSNQFTEKYPDIVDLKREAAFNLHLIYKDSENYAGARNILNKYLRIYFEFHFIIPYYSMIIIFLPKI